MTVENMRYRKRAVKAKDGGIGKTNNLITSGNNLEVMG